jgi:SecD/SecF fusion protein
VRFRYTYAIASLAALTIDVLSMLAIFAIFRIEVQVEFVSAVLAIIGYSINDTVVIFDRIREISKETNFGNIDEEGRYNIVNKALQNCATRSFWTTISTMLPVIALIFVGADATVAFSIAMLVGLVSGIFSSLFVAPSLWLVLEKGHMRRLKEKAIRDAEKVGHKKSNGPDELTVVGIND